MSASVLAASLGLTRRELGRAWPFFIVYTLLFMALSIADAVSLSLFASRIGTERLPAVYSATALLSLVAVGLYLSRVTRTSAGTIFGWILGGTSVLFLAAWTVHGLYGGTLAVGSLFITREVALTLVLMHFGTFLQDYFLRDEMNRILPVIYAGGRAGGMIGGGLVSQLAERIGTVNLVPIVVGLLVLAWIGIGRIRTGIGRQIEPEEIASPTALDSEARPSVARSLRAFAAQLRGSPLMIWLTVTTLLFVACRWFLAFQYTSFFESHFEDEAAFAGFLGRYTQIALLVSFLLQLFVVNRLVAWWGVPGTHLAYCLLVFGGLLGNLIWVGFPLAVASRFVENELRFGIRNPVNQMMVNRFSRKLRIVVRGWTLGWLIPVSTLMASGLISGLSRLGGPLPVAVGGCVLGVGLVAAAIRIRWAYRHFEPT